LQLVIRKIKDELLFFENNAGFYCDEVNKSTRLRGEISEELAFSLREGQSTGKAIAADEAGNPILVDPPEPTADELIALAEETRTD
jgi:hypothetical protein